MSHRSPWEDFEMHVYVTALVGISSGALSGEHTKSLQDDRLLGGEAEAVNYTRAH